MTADWLCKACGLEDACPEGRLCRVCDSDGCRFCTTCCAVRQDEFFDDDVLPPDQLDEDEF